MRVCVNLMFTNVEANISIFDKSASEWLDEFNTAKSLNTVLWLPEEGGLEGSPKQLLMYKLRFPSYDYSIDFWIQLFIYGRE